MVGTMLALGTFAAGFLARPIGAIVLGHLGDKHGRRATLVASLMLMGVATTLIAFIPSYAAIGLAAPLLLLLLRLIQGFALGGEWGGGAVLLVSEHSNESTRRAFWSSWPNMGPPLGNLMAAGVLAILAATMPESEFLAWGWRIAFGLSALLVVIGLILRLYVQETPLFKEAQRKREAEGNKERKLPLTILFRRNWREILIATGSRMGENAGFYIYSLFIITYVTQIMGGLQRQTGLTAVMIGQGVAVVAIPILAVYADKVGRKPILIGASIATMVWAFAFFFLLNTGQVWGHHCRRRGRAPDLRGVQLSDRRVLLRALPHGRPVQRNLSVLQHGITDRRFVVPRSSPWRSTALSAPATRSASTSPPWADLHGLGDVRQGNQGPEAQRSGQRLDPRLEKGKA